MDKFGREHFEKMSGAVESAKKSLQENVELTQGLRVDLAGLAAKENISFDEIIAIAKRLKKEINKGKSGESLLQKAQEKYDRFYDDMHGHALLENELRYTLKEAIKEGDYEKIINAAEKLKQHDTLKDPKGFDAKGTQEIYDEFASQFKYISGLAEGKARVRLDNGKCAFIDHDGKVVSKEYKYAGPYSEGKAWVQLDNGKYAFIDHDGKVASKEYKYAGSYSEGKARVWLDNGKHAFIDHDGKVINFKQ